MSDYVLTEEELELVRDLQQLRDQQKALKDEEKQIRDEVLEILQKKAATRGLTASGSQVVTVTEVHRRTVNSKKLEALYPEVHAAVVEEKSTVMVKLG